MGYIILNTDRDDEMGRIRENMRHVYMRHESSPYMRDDHELKEKYYREGYRHAVEDMDDREEYRRARDSRGRYV